MKKTLTANISGTVFHIEEDAYEQLHRYLASVRGQFTGSEGRDEIMADIEARIAELFTERLGGKRQVVSTEDVDHVIAVMGRPEDYTDGGATADDGAASGPAYQGPKSRRLFRDPDDKWVGGVLGGIGAYFNIDPLILRLVYLVSLFLGFGFLLYLILWIVVPKAETAAEKLSMRGEEVNVENIKRMFEEGAEQFGKRAREVAGEAREMGHRYGPQARRGGEEVAAFLGEAVRLFASGLGKLIGLALLLAGAVVAILLMVAVLGKFGLLVEGSGLGDGPDPHQWALLLFDSPAQANWTWIALVAFLLVPVVGLLYGGISLLFGVKAPKWFGLAMTPVWIAAIVVLSFIGILMGGQFRARETVRDTVRLETPAGRTIVVMGSGEAPDHHWRRGHRHDLDIAVTEGDSVRMNWTGLTVRRSDDGDFHLVVERRARGSSRKDAARRAEAITASHTLEDDTLRLGHWFAFPLEDRFRGQRVRYILEVPIGSAVRFDRSVRGMIDDIDNVGNTRDRDMVGRTWTMTRKGLDDTVRPEEVPVDQPATAAPTVNVTTSGRNATLMPMAARNRAVPFQGPRPQRPRSSGGSPDQERAIVMPNLLELLLPRS